MRSGTPSCTTPTIPSHLRRSLWDEADMAPLPTGEFTCMHQSPDLRDDLRNERIIARVLENLRQGPVVTISIVQGSDKALDPLAGVILRGCATLFLVSVFFVSLSFLRGIFYDFLSLVKCFLLYMRLLLLPHTVLIKP